MGSGTSSEPIAYSFVDERPFNGVSYYKLIQTDYDGVTADAGIVLVRMANSTKLLELVSYPNPFRDQAITLSLSGLNDKESVSVIIVDAFGKQQYLSNYSADENGYLDAEFDESVKWNSGIYVIIIHTEKDQSNLGLLNSKESLRVIFYKILVMIYLILFTFRY